RHVLRVVSEILSFSEKSRRTSIGAGLEFLSHVVRRKAVAFLISDFLAPVQSYERPLRITARRHDLIPVRIGDPLEEGLPNVGLIEIEDPETGEAVVFDTGGPEAAAFARGVRRQWEARRDLFKRLSMDPIERATDRPYLPALTSFFESRARRLRHCGGSARWRRWPPGPGFARRAFHARLGATAASRRPIRTPPPWRRTRTRPRRMSAIRSTSTWWPSARAPYRSTCRRRWSLVRSRCSIARRASRTWATGG